MIRWAPVAVVIGFLMACGSTSTTTNAGSPTTASVVPGSAGTGTSASSTTGTASGGPDGAAPDLTKYLLQPDELNNDLHITKLPKTEAFTPGMTYGDGEQWMQTGVFGSGYYADNNGSGHYNNTLNQSLLQFASDGDARTALTAFEGTFKGTASKGGSFSSPTFDLVKNGTPTSPGLIPGDWIVADRGSVVYAASVGNRVMVLWNNRSDNKEHLQQATADSQALVNAAVARFKAA